MLRGSINRRQGRQRRGNIMQIEYYDGEPLIYTVSRTYPPFLGLFALHEGGIMELGRCAHPALLRQCIDTLLSTLVDVNLEANIGEPIEGEYHV